MACLEPNFSKGLFRIEKTAKAASKMTEVARAKVTMPLLKFITRFYLLYSKLYKSLYLTF